MRLVIVLALFLAAGCASSEREPPPTPLELGIMAGDVDYVATHAEARRTRPGWQPVLQDALDSTAQACRTLDHETTIQLYDALLASGANLNLPLMLREDDETLHLNRAAFFCSADVLAHLIAAGAQVNAATVDGTTPLMSAADAYYFDINRKVDVLLDAGANAGAEDAEGRTALDYALANRRVRSFTQVMATLTVGAPQPPEPLAELVR